MAPLIKEVQQTHWFYELEHELLLFDCSFQITFEICFIYNYAID